MRAPIDHSGKRGDQLGVVARIRFRLAGVARALHTGRAVQRLDADAGIIRERRQLGQRACMARLRERVLDERRMGLIGLGNAELALRNDVDAERREQPGKLAELAGIAGGEDPTRDHVLSAAFCAAMSLRIPRSPSATSASICSRENGAPSAVPCSSTKPPAPVITMFMSVSHAESSA